MICQASRFIDDPKSLIGDSIDAFFDFSCLVEAVVLRDSLFVLEGDLVERSLECKDLPLFDTLKKEGIINEKKLPLDKKSIVRALSSVLGVKRTFEKININGFLTSVANLVPDAFTHEVDHLIANNNFPEGDKYQLLQLLQHKNASNALGTSEDVFDFFQGDAFLGLLRGTGDMQRGGYVLRTFIYSQTAETENICFMPDYVRIPILESLNESIYTNIVLDGYLEFSKKLEWEAKDFLKDASPMGLAIPPFTAILLDRCKSSDDIPNILLELRHEFRELRSNLSKLEGQLKVVANIHERNKMRKSIESVFEAISKKYNSTGYLKLKKSIDFIGDAARPIYNWKNPSSYKASLITNPMDWIRDWWLRRPLIHLFDVADKFRRINEFNLLIEKKLGIKFETDEIRRFNSTQELYSKLLANNSPK